MKYETYKDLKNNGMDVVSVQPTEKQAIESEEDPVNSPSHYNKDGIECIQAIKASMENEEYQGYLKGNTLKYLWRYRYKGNPVQDLGKAQWYLNRLIDSVKKEKEDV